MTDREYEILDELYFAISFEELIKKVELEEEILKKELLEFVKKDWVKCMVQMTDEEISDMNLIEAKYKEYNFLATKKGLFAHNSR